VENTVKHTLTLSVDAIQVLERQASPRKRGEFVSKLLIQYGAVDSGIDAVDIESVKLQIMGLASANKSLEARVLKLERQLAAVIANSSK
jgi:cell division protein FtsB